MAELVAIDQQSKQRWRRELPEGEMVRLGRAPRTGWKVGWDEMISREHADLLWNNGQLKVRRLATARNPIYFNGDDTGEFIMSVGDEFLIGRTSFQVVDVEVINNPTALMEELSYGAEDIRKFQFRNANHRLEAISKLPQLISQSTSDEDFATNFVQLLLEAVPHSEAAAVVQYSDSAETSQPEMMRWESRSEAAGRFRPSRRLIQSSLSRGQSVLHVWNDLDESEHEFTMTSNLDWAFCTPINNDACRGWTLYVSGKFGGGDGSSQILNTNDLKGDLRFTELLAQFIGTIQQARKLETGQARLSEYFSAAVMETLTGDDAVAEEALTPKERDVTVLFCDVRGFSKKAEQAEHAMQELLNRVNEALGVMTRGIVKYEGVIADFQGDAALGFWGWPNPLLDGPLSACRAALDIQSEFRCAVNDGNSSLSDFRVGIGIAHGHTIAGRIGTAEQSKVGVFGPVVNLGSRLEGLTKQLRAPILLDEATADYVRRNLPSNEGRCRRLGKVRPYGMDRPVNVSELLPPIHEDDSVTDQNIVDYEAAVAAVTDGRWNEALEYLDRLPSRDRAKDFLVLFIAENDYEPPLDWDGIIPIKRK